MQGYFIKAVIKKKKMFEKRGEIIDLHIKYT